MRYYVEATITDDDMVMFASADITLVDITDGNGRFRVNAASPERAAINLVNSCDDLDLAQTIAVQASPLAPPVWFRYDADTDQMIEEEEADEDRHLADEKHQERRWRVD